MGKNVLMTFVIIVEFILQCQLLKIIKFILEQ